MTSDEIRSAFLDFFVEKKHKVIPSASLVPKGDPTLLLTTAGMVQFKPYFLGQAVPPNPRLASCQKCFRTTDIEVVGDSSHLTFFEMLGNFSVGDYFKKEAIEWGWEFVTRRLGLPPERLWVTIFLDDDEAFRLWRKQGIPESRILRFGEEDNFWGPAGDSGPCGPCSEIHYDFGEEFGCGQPSCAPNCTCGRFSEVWNLVFMQYNQDKAGKRTPLPRPNIDTGLGLERTAAVMQGKTSVYETDLFLPLLDYIAGLAGRKYRADSDIGNAMRVIAEHGRGIAFLIGDGVTPSNEGRGYVLRRLLRRAVLFGRRLGLSKPFLAEVAKVTIGQMKHIYPELKQRKDFILKTIEFEETRFNETLTTGLELLDDIMSRVTSKGESKISGKKAFKLYDTYGFPVELTREIATERGLAVDIDGFEKEMEKQRERARADQRAKGTLKGTLKGRGALKGALTALKKATPFVGYRTLEHKSVIIGILVDGKSVDSVAAGQEASLILDSTPFYAEMGGQVGDSGEISSHTARFAVANTARIPTDIVAHQGKVTEGSFSTGGEVIARVDGERRRDIARNHTATHLLQAALREVLGEHVQQKGSLVAPQRLRFDFSHPVALTREEIDRVNHIVNQKIRQNLKAYDEELAYKKALAEGAIALFEEKYGDKVRVMKIGEPVISAELCGGTHVATTGEIGFFHIISESSIGAGLRRIEAVTGRGAEEFIAHRFVDLEKIAEYLDAKPDNILDRAQSLSSELKNERRRSRVLERELFQKEAESLLGKTEVRKKASVLAVPVSPMGMDRLREMSDFLKDRLMKDGFENSVVVLGTVWQDRPAFVANVAPNLVAQGYNAGDIVNQVAKVAGGGGGGKAGIAQAGGKDEGKLKEAVGRAPEIIEKMYP